MKKKILITTLSLVAVLAFGSGVIWQYHKNTPEQKLLDAYNAGEPITIEIANPVSQEQGTEVEFEWKELASLNTYDNFRFTVEDELGIITLGEAGKNGVLYVDLEGNHTNNSTMMYAFMNQKFRDNVWNNSDTLSAIVDATKENYVDVETDAVAKVAFLNAYYNIFNDAEPNYFNGYQTLTRAEFLEGIYRACNPVSELTVNDSLMSAVDSTGKDTSVPFASAMLEYNYLGLADKSLNNGTYNGTISRAEAIYTLVQMFYKTEYDATTGKESAYSDTKNGGDIATEIGLIQTDKKTGVVTTHDYLASYELSYALQNPDGGMPDELYRAMVVAKNHGIITSAESRWDEGITKGEAITFLVNIFNNMDALTNAERGAANGDMVISIDWDSINPATHSTYDAETGKVTVDDTIISYMMENVQYFIQRKFDEKVTEKALSIYLEGYYTDRFGDNEWLQFAITGDTNYLNFEVSDAELLIQVQQEMDAYLNSEEGQQAMQDMQEQMQNQQTEDPQELAAKYLAETLGISIEEARAMLENGGNPVGNGGGGSTPVANPDTNQGNATDENYVTPETDNPSNGNPGGSGGNSGEKSPNLGANDDAAGDGGDLVTDGTLNP